ncbi:DUF3426 domain-containing protein [Pseudomonas benzenivorans]|uniref:DUF3426 domain-containing protein n=1 Tax=Pseudomonas benzenivorans TaxID=556533 RepID=A0ABZ0PXW6_9PSED|nr:DUF3426 domain-containing protein [Pseudomonas benzenivorans]WPC05704.1 DUF3426 domain-containing protein [Pseudomonas benzenivorans]
MTETFVTQCPHCRTSFRVNQAQLGAAHGVVRCGACLHVFNAAQQLRAQGHDLADTAPTQAPPASPASAAQAPAGSSAPAAAAKSDDRTPPSPANATLWIHDDLDLDSLDLDEELAKLEEQEQQLSQQFRALEQAPRYAEAFRPLSPHEPVADDEQWAEALLREDATKTAPNPSPSAPQHLPESSQAPLAPPPQEHASPAPRQEPRLEPSEEDTTAASPDKDEPRLSATRDEPDAELEEDEPPAEPAGKHGRNEPELRDEHLFELDDEPLQLDWQPPRTPWARWFGWGLLNLIAAGALAGQYLIYHFEELARQDQYRPWFEQLCPSLGCILPSKVDIEQVKSSNLVVRSHPEFSGALVVDAILYNRAPFAQPFPLLEMRFADINGQLLASRRFKPSEYLAGELAGQAEMPPQTPIHVSLDILDPGTRAVNYSLSFHSPE